ncbi:MAG TPA: hypothetical protein DDX06_01065 [Curvibacter sp.]|nr:hypothetical protein [Curvibacter sp.]|tara:strand:+ start:111 stop:368 length:258 start_codon:yes stop_codon:yes gene_type:complete
MKRTIIYCAAIAACLPALADNWTIDQKTRDDCAKEGGCVLTIPDGHLIKLKDINQAIDQIAQQAFEAGAMHGLAAGKQTCGRKDI